MLKFSDLSSLIDKVSFKGNSTSLGLVLLEKKMFTRMPTQVLQSDDITRPLPGYVSPVEHNRGRNTFSKIFTIFHFPLKSKMATESGEN